MHPDELLERLKANANLRKQKNLEIIHSICREQIERGSKDFSVATIARLSQGRGGPVKSTIHNKTGDDFKGLINAWAKHTGGLTKRERKVNESPVHSVLDKIERADVRSVMGSVLAENKTLRRQLDILKAGTKVVIDLRKWNDSPPSEILSAVVDLTESEKTALRHAISDQTMKDEGWKIDAYGRILNGKNRTIFKPGFVHAIRKILDEGCTPTCRTISNSDGESQ